MSSFDALTLAAVVHELNKTKGATIERIYQPTKTDVTMQIHFLAGSKRLFFSTHPSFARVHYTQRHYINPENPSPFCMLLRKHFKGGKIEAFEQPGLERILYLKVLNLDQDGCYRVKTLVAELMGRHSNLILIDGDPSDNPIILGSIKAVTSSMSRFRTILPGKTYLLPPAQKKLNLLDPTYPQSEETVKQQFTEITETPASLVNTVQGISPLIAREIINRILPAEDARIQEEHHAQSFTQKLWEEIQKLRETCRQNSWQPSAVFDNDNKDKYVAFAPMKLTLYPDTQQTPFKSISHLLDTFFLNREESEKTQQLSKLLVNRVEQILTRNKKKRRSQRAELAYSKSSDRYRLRGELLLANLSQIPKGAKKVTLPNFYQEDQKITVLLDPSISATANAQRYFNKYRKSKRSCAKIQAQLQTTEGEIKYLESILYNLEKAGLEDLSVIKQELEESGYIKVQKKKKKHHGSISSPSCFISSDGHRILAGRNNRQNDIITFNLASKQDTWLHVKDLPGAHIIINKDSPPSKTLEEAAMLAAFFSKGADSANVPVDYTLVRYVRKLPGAKPGMVTYKNHRTIFVTPDKEQVNRLRSKLAAPKIMLP